MSFIPEHPFSNYKIGHDTFNKSLGRWQVYLYNSNIDNLTMLKSRYLMCVKLGYILDSNINVDHKDEDKTNDSINNLQLLTLSQNVKKYFDFRRGGTPKVEKYKCSHCGKEFTEDHGLANQRKQQTKSGNLFCSMGCSIKSRAIINTIPKEEQEKIAMLRKSGLTLKQVKDKTGYGIPTIAKYQGDAIGLNKLSLDKENKIKELIVKGFNNTQISKELKIGRSTVARYK